MPRKGGLLNFKFINFQRAQTPFKDFNNIPERYNQCRGTQCRLNAVDFEGYISSFQEIDEEKANFIVTRD